MNKRQIVERYGVDLVLYLEEPFFDYDRREEYWEDYQVESALQKQSKERGR